MTNWMIGGLVLDQNNSHCIAFQPMKLNVNLSTSGLIGIFCAVFVINEATRKNVIFFDI